MNKSGICTIATKSHVSIAVAALASYARHNPGTQLFLLLIDSNRDCYGDYLQVDSDSVIELLYLSELVDEADLTYLSFAYNAFELCCAARPILHAYLYGLEDLDTWLYVDSDTYCLANIEDIFDVSAKKSISLTPHISSFEYQNYPEFIASGLYNGGFLGLSKLDESKRFIDWFFSLDFFDEKSVKAPTFYNGNIYVDQKWLDLVPIFFQEIHQILDEGINAGHWRLFKNGSFTLRKDSNKLYINNSPLRVFHFSGFCPEQPGIVSRYKPYDLSHDPTWRQLSHDYVEHLTEFQILSDSEPYTYNTFIDGEPISPWMRRVYAYFFKKNEFTDNPFNSCNFFIDYSKVNALDS